MTCISIHFHPRYQKSSSVPVEGQIQEICLILKKKRKPGLQNTIQQPLFLNKIPRWKEVPPLNPPVHYLGGLVLFLHPKSNWWCHSPLPHSNIAGPFKWKLPSNNFMMIPHSVCFVFNYVAKWNFGFFKIFNLTI